MRPDSTWGWLLFEAAIEIVHEATPFDLALLDRLANEEPDKEIRENLRKAASRARER